MSRLYDKSEQAAGWINARLLAITYEFEVATSERQKNRLEEEARALRTAKYALDRQIPVAVSDKTATLSIACGTRLCPDCQNSIKLGQEFCDKCGQALGWEVGDGK